MLSAFNTPVHVVENHRAAALNAEIGHGENGGADLNRSSRREEALISLAGITTSLLPSAATRVRERRFDFFILRHAVSQLLDLSPERLQIIIGQRHFFDGLFRSEERRVGKECRS